MQAWYLFLQARQHRHMEYDYFAWGTRELIERIEKLESSIEKYEEKLIETHEELGMTRSDAQGCVEAWQLTNNITT